MKTSSTKPRFCLGVSTVKQREQIGWENVTTTSNHQPSQYDEFDSLFHGQVSWCERMLNLSWIVNWSTPDVLFIHQIIIFDGFYPWMFRLINGWLSWTPSHQPHEKGVSPTKQAVVIKLNFRNQNWPNEPRDSTVILEINVNHYITNPNPFAKPQITIHPPPSWGSE
jgi:hypothetical protein